MASKVFVGNLSYNTTKEQVQELFAQAGTLTDVFLPTDRETGRMRGFAFVTFESDDDAQKAIAQFNGQQLDGRPLRVNPAEEKPKRDFKPRSYGGGDMGGGGGYDDGGFGGGFGGGGGGYGGGGGANKPKGSRRNIRGKKRSL
jgi:cold-inducible RNA-binding protein